VYKADATDKTAPTVLNTIPAASAEAVSPTSSLVVYFDDMIDPATIKADSVTVSADSAAKAAAATKILGTISVTISANGKCAIVTFTPYTAMPANSSVSLVITGVKDKGGNSLAADKTVSFTTGTVVTTSTASLEFDDGGAGVTFAGDGKIISLPMWGIPAISGPNAAAITNGNSGDFKSTASGTISGTAAIKNQYSSISTGKIAVPANKTKLVFSYYFVSAEFLEYLGSSYDDNVTVSVAGPNGAKSVMLTSVNKFTSAEAKATLTKVSGMTSDSYITPLTTGSIDISGLGNEVSFSATVSDVSDLILTSMFIVDNIHFE
jgi:hypothetical protein